LSLEMALQTLEISVTSTGLPVLISFNRKWILPVAITIRLSQQLSCLACLTRYTQKLPEAQYPVLKVQQGRRVLRELMVLKDLRGLKVRRVHKGLQVLQVPMALQ
jgi:hypothetical protein